ncbi:acyltransferase family protein [Ornithinibacillus californiensis]|uniref:acyltransferase family protein n=1 Tax=Ornithinibacillus californiensis TaxID=161536 RepID=UPI00064DDA98|nr:acyltransferase [Ornithinibacillus californiensis]
MERNYTIDYVKFIAVVLVVGVHTFTYNINWQDNLFIYGLIHYFPRWVIPYFFIVSGYLLGVKISFLKQRKDYLNQYLFKLVKLFVTWFFIYVLFDLMNRVVYSIYFDKNIWLEIMNYFHDFFRVTLLYDGVIGTGFHLWFLTALIWSILILYIFIYLDRVHFILLLGFLLNIIGLFGQTYGSIFQVSFDTRDALFFGLFYITLGYYIGSNNDAIINKCEKVKSRYLILIFILSSIMQVTEKVSIYHWFAATDGIGEYYLSTIPMTVSLFILVLKYRYLGKNNIIADLGGAAVGIYVAHMVILSTVILLMQFLNIDHWRENYIVNLVLVLIVIYISYYTYILINTFLFHFKNLLMNRKEVTL